MISSLIDELIGYFYSFFSECFKNFCPFTTYLSSWVLRALFYAECESFVSYIDYESDLLWLVFHLVNGAFWKGDIFHFDVGQLIGLSIFSLMVSFMS